MTVLFSKHKTEKEAWDKIVWMGNQVAKGATIAQIAKDNSDGFTATKGGFWDWTEKGSLASKELEDAIFTLPVGQLSPIIKGEKGFHIVQPVEREESKTTPFIDAQVTIREKIKMQRRQKYHEEYFTALKQRYPTIILRETVDLKQIRPTATSVPVGLTNR